MYIQIKNISNINTTIPFNNAPPKPTTSTLKQYKAANTTNQTTPLISKNQHRYVENLEISGETGDKPCRTIRLLV